MKSLVFLSLASVRAFVVPTPGRRQTTPLHALSFNLPENLKPYKFVNLFVAPPPVLPTSAVEGAECFRTLGIPPSASYEEVQAAVEELKVKYAGEKKLLMKIDVAKDKISELRLKQRVRGQLAQSKESRKFDKMVAKADDVEKKRKSFKRIPVWILRAPAMWIPPWKIKDIKNSAEKTWAQAHVLKARNYYLVFVAACIFFPASYGAIKFLSLFLFYSHMVQRGKAPVVRDGEGMQGAVEQNQDNFRDYLWALFLMLPAYVAGFVLAEAIVPYAPFLRPYQTHFLCETSFYFLADLCFQPMLANPKKNPTMKPIYG